MNQKKYFLGSVGTAEAFRVDSEGHRRLAFSSKTLTESAVNISITVDDIRAGQGAPVVASFAHDSVAEFTLTDVFWKKEYVEAQLGAKFDANQNAYQSETLVAGTDGVVTLSKTPIALPFSCDGSRIIVWYSPKGEDNWDVIELENSSVSVTIPEGVLGVEYCVRYLASDERANAALINADMMPEELFLIITTPLYAGDACAASNGSIAGSITFEVPRFKLNGNQSFSFAMSSNSTMSLSGKALADNNGCYDVTKGGGKLLKIIEVVYDRKWTDDLTAIYFEESEATAASMQNKVVKVYGVYRNKSVTLLDNTKLTFAGTGATINGEGKITTNTTGTITVKAMKDSVVIDSDILTLK